MKQKSWAATVGRLIQRLGCGLCACGVVWLSWHTATTVTVTELGQTLWDQAALPLLQWELGALESQEVLSTATIITLRQSAFLDVARATVSDLWSMADGDDAPEQTDTQDKTPIYETPTLQAPTALDNGVEALTLTPGDASSYVRYGAVYISATADVALDTQDLASPTSVDLSADGPQILILHTHATEAYTPADADAVVYSGDMRTLDPQYSVIAVGAAMAEVFTDMGLSVIHDTTLYDYPSYNDAYDKALAGIEQCLADNPTISVVLDVHRDAIEDEAGNQYKLVTDLDDGSRLAQLCLVVGTDGGGLDHPDWLENLRLATAVQQSLAQDYPTLMRPMLLRNSRYNQHMTTGSLLLEVGSAGNSPEEAIAAGELFALALSEVLIASQ